jgi:hypothetical protein
MATQTTGRSLDELAKGLATGTLSRGKAIRLVGGALLGATLASVPGTAWADGCRRLGRECRRDSQCCSRNCVRRGDDKVCACPEGQIRCKDRCVNLERNERHCGRCFNRCAEGEQCVDGVCQGGGCQGGTQECGAVVCQAGETCVNGQCVAGTCTQLGTQCGTCTGEGGSTEFCVCERSADGAGSFCRGPLVACASCCDECGVFGGVNLPVCVQSGNPPGGGCEFYCTSTCYGPDGTTCGFV